MIQAVGEILVFCAGVVVMSTVSLAIDRLLGIEVLGSRSGRIGHNILGMAKGGFMVWLMSVTIFGN